LFLGIGTPNRRANVGAMSTWTVYKIINSQGIFEAKIPDS